MFCHWIYSFGSFTSIFNFLAFYLHRPPYELSYTWIGLIPVSFSLTFSCAICCPCRVEYWVDECAQYADHLYDGRCISHANRPFSVGFHFRYRFTVSRIFLCSFHRISLGQFTESKRKRTGDIVLSALLLRWRCSNGVFQRVSFLLAGMECYCGIMSDDAGDRIIYLPVYFRKIWETTANQKTVSSGEFLIIDTKCVFILSIMESSFFH